MLKEIYFCLLVCLHFKSHLHSLGHYLCISHSWAILFWIVTLKTYFKYSAHTHTHRRSWCLSLYMPWITYSPHSLYRSNFVIEELNMLLNPNVKITFFYKLNSQMLCSFGISLTPTLFEVWDRSNTWLHYPPLPW